MASNRSRPLLLIVHADHPDRSLDSAIGTWFAERARAHGRFDVEVLNAQTWETTPPAGRVPGWRAQVASADAFAFVATDQDAVLRAPLLDLVEHAPESWRLKPFGTVRVRGRSGERLARTLAACLRDLTAVASSEDVVLPDAAAALKMGVVAVDASIAARAEAQLMDLARLHTALCTMRPMRSDVAVTVPRVPGLASRSTDAPSVARPAESSMVAASTAAVGIGSVRSTSPGVEVRTSG